MGWMTHGCGAEESSMQLVPALALVTAPALAMQLAPALAQVLILALDM